MLKGKYTCIDAHCHVYPKKILPRAVDATGVFYCETPRHDGTTEQLFEYGVKCGIDKFIVQSVATTKNQVGRINDYIASQVAAYPDRLYGLGTAHPESDDMRADLEHVKELGLLGIKIHPDIQGFKVDCPGFEKAYDICEELGLTVLMHTGDRRYDYSNPNRIAPLLERHPGLTVVGAHLGGWSIWENAVDYLAGYDNFYVDCSSSLGYITPEKARQVIRKYGADKVLFGTDYPLHFIEKEVDNFLRLDLTDEECRLILAENAKKVYSL